MSVTPVNSTTLTASALAQQGDTLLEQLEAKIHAYVILGQVLQGAALAACVGAVVSSFLVTPWALCAIPIAVTLAVLGRRLEKYEGTYPFVPDQPVGLLNHGNDCWLNSTLQLILNSPFLEGRAKKALLPSFASAMENYHTAQQAEKSVAATVCTKDLRAQLRALTGLQTFSPDGQDDPLALVDRILTAPAAHINFEERVLSENPVRIAPPVPVGVVQFPIPRKGLFQLLDSLATYLHSSIPEAHPPQERQRRFPVPPQDLLFQLGRFHLLSTGRTEKVSDALDIPERFVLPGNHCVNGASVPYECTAFIEHIGSLNGGHYVAYVKKGALWWLCDDSRVTPISHKTALAAMRRGYIYHFHQTL